MIEYLLLFAGLAFLVKGGEWLVDGASSLASRVGVPPLVIGLTVVAFGTSLPELLVSVLAALQGSSDIAFGNVVGSNLANILLILGIAAIIAPIKVQRSTTLSEVPFSFLAAALLFTFSLAPALDGIPGHDIYRFEGIILLLIFCVFIVYALEMTRKASRKAKKEDQGIHTHTPARITVLLVGGLAALYFGGQWTVDGAVAVATVLGLSEYVIASTIIAVGTSLPELVTTVIAARKGNADLAVGNVIGSNIFNILWILGVTAIIAPIGMPPSALWDVGLLLGVTALLFGFLYLWRKHALERWQGILFLVLYATYIVFLVWRG